MSTIGLVASIKKTVTLGRMHMSTFQWTLKICYKENISTPRNTKKLIFTVTSNAGSGAQSGQNSTARRALVSFRKAPSHQPIRNEGSSSGSAILQDRLQEQLSPYRPRQHLSVGLYQQTGRHKISRTLCSNVENLEARHVLGSLNVITDGLSRRNQIQSTEWSLSPQIFKQISKLWESPQVDLFATSLNKKLPTYVFPISNPQAWAVGPSTFHGKTWLLMRSLPPPCCPRLYKNFNHKHTG